MELWMPIFVISSHISEELLDKTIRMAQEASEARMQNNMMENHDVVLVAFLHDLISGEDKNKEFSVKEMVEKFVETNGLEEWFTREWVGRALARNSLVRRKRRIARGVEVVLDFEKIVQKAKQFGIVADLAVFTSNLHGVCETCRAGDRDLLRLPHQHMAGKPVMAMCTDCAKEYGGFV